MTTENELDSGFEDPNYGGSKYENWTLKPDTTAQYRILPSMKSLRKKKDYTEFWYTHFWTGLDPKNSAKKKSIPILCIQEKDFNRNGMITRQCPLCLKRDKYKNKVKAIEAQGAAKNASKNAIAGATQQYNLWLKDHGHDGKYRVYAINKAGQYGVLRLTPTCMKKLRDKVKKLVQDGHSPMSLQKGVWFEFTRTGKGFSTEDEVQVARIEKPDGSSVIDFHTMTNDMARAALDTLPDFEEERERISYDEEILNQLAACNDDPAEVNRILGIKEQEADGDADFGAGFCDDAGPTAVAEDDDFGGPSGAMALDDEPAAAAEPEADDEEAALLAQMAALKAKKAAAAAKAAASAATTKPATKEKTPSAKTEAASFDPLTSNDADFDALFEKTK